VSLSPGELLKVRQIANADPANTSPAWRTLSEAQTKIAQTKTDALGLTVATAPDATKIALNEENPPPGFYAPAAARIVLEGNLLPVEPDKLRPTEDQDHLKALSVLHGVLIHECGHFSHTEIDHDRLSEESQEVQQAAILLEEIRMEAQVVKNNSSDACFLRSSAKELIMTDAQLESEHGAISAGVLIEGRVQAGSLQASDVTQVIDEIDNLLDADTVTELKKITKRTVKIADGDIESLIRAAKRLAKLFPKDGSGGGKGKIKELIEGALNDDLSPSQAEELEEMLADAKARGEIAEALKNAEVKTAGSAAGSEPKEGERVATDIERKARNDLSAKFRQVRWWDRHKVNRTSVLPPGKLKARNALQRSAEVATGKMATSKPWKQTKRRLEIMPKLSLGVLVDTSGSMYFAKTEMAGALWSLAHAAYENDGKVGAALFGDTSKLLWGPHSVPPRHVVEITPSGGTEYLPDGIDLLDKALNWKEDKGPRLLVIISDGYFYKAAESQQAIREIQKKGVKVIQLGINMTPTDHGANQVLTVNSASELSTVIGGAAIKELREW
jgi:hypothetical protein